jgi:DNA-binding CsgD family transcriptional regulator
VDQRQIEAALDACYDAVVDPASWSDALHKLARSLDAACCMFYPQHPEDTLLQMPASHDFRDFLDEFVNDGWWLHDHRAERGWPLLKAGRTVILEEDVASAEERRRLPAYNELYPRYELSWWAALGFRVAGRQWGLPIQRTVNQGRFSQAEAIQMEQIIPHLRRMISISEKVTLGRVISTLDTLDWVQTAALAIDWKGRVIRLNQHAESLLGSDIFCIAGRLQAKDHDSDTRLQALLAAAIADDAADISSSSASVSARPVTVQRSGRRPLVVEAMPAGGLFADVLHQARALVFFSEPEARVLPSADRLAVILRITPAEARLLARLVAGDQLMEASHTLGISFYTARSQLRSLFAKTGTHRQAELIGLAERVSLAPRKV